jgi:hypothetical protein
MGAMPRPQVRPWASCWPCASVPLGRASRGGMPPHASGLLPPVPVSRGNLGRRPNPGVSLMRSPWRRRYAKLWTRCAASRIGSPTPGPRCGPPSGGSIPARPFHRGRAASPLLLCLREGRTGAQPGVGCGGSRQSMRSKTSDSEAGRTRHQGVELRAPVPGQMGPELAAQGLGGAHRAAAEQAHPAQDEGHDGGMELMSPGEPHRRDVAVGDCGAGDLGQQSPPTLSMAPPQRACSRGRLASARASRPSIWRRRGCAASPRGPGLPETAATS